MIDECGPKRIVVGGRVDEQDRFVEPTILKGTHSYVMLYCCSGYTCM